MADGLKIRLGVHNRSDGQIVVFRESYRQMPTREHKHLIWERSFNLRCYARSRFKRRRLP
jgi:hypothetical protein